MDYKIELKRLAVEIHGKKRTAATTQDVALAFTKYLIGDREIAIRDLQKLKNIPNQVLGFEYHEDNYNQTFDKLYKKFFRL
ncbi:MAG: hypothetical protein M0P12_00820 [Paludibacteraceae bacterium]|nr:hypothetical protein [Paludibacteraceae bacterium]